MPTPKEASVLLSHTSSLSAFKAFKLPGYTKLGFTQVRHPFSRHAKSEAVLRQQSRCFHSQ